MNAGPAESEPDVPSPALPPSDDAETGLPGLRTWPQVYIVVSGIFFVWLALLTTLTVMFS